jgi:predicted deacylase
METLIVGSARALPGAKGEGAVDVARRADGTAISIPVVVVNGLHDGPTLVVEGAVHGSEYPGVVAVWSLLDALDPQVLHGQLIAVPVVNVPAFEVDNRVNPIDHQDMNRIFPGKPDGTLSERTAHALVTQIIHRADYFIDLHAASVGDIVPVAIAREKQGPSMQLAQASGMEFIWVGSIGEAKLGPSTQYALRQGIPSVTMEAGGGRELHQEAVDALKNAVTNIMKHLGMLEGEPDKPKRRLYFSADLWPQVGVGGFFQSHAIAGQRVKSGDLICSILDVYGREMERLEAPRDGVICLITKRCSVQAGDYSCIFGDILEEETLE